ncbi:hypothetical protein THRCLA_07325 [Thraustotheca clavata]|uniref:Uncharacterized protein n=1 Tax=Thraustotheca clavata TaxID=74557 RepID=A0A1V9ZE80_9STRA|nr:hypothetical protein THRCLA_07325 [Thraustotheca clavata]
MDTYPSAYGGLASVFKHEELRAVSPRLSRRYRVKSQSELEIHEANLRESISEESVSGRWSTEEQNAFIEGLTLYGKDWKKIALMIPTRTLMQIRTHAQKYFKKLEKEEKIKDAKNNLGSDDCILKQSQWNLIGDELLTDFDYDKRQLTGERRHRSSSVPSPATDGRRDSDPRHGLVKGKLSKPSPPKNSTKRSGRWTKEEEDYATRLINDFDKGILPLPDGILLRMFLAKTLQCDPMRISKKFAGVLPKSKQTYVRNLSVIDTMSYQEQLQNRRELAALEHQFFIATNQISPPEIASLPPNEREEVDDTLQEDDIDFLLQCSNPEQTPVAQLDLFKVSPMVCSPPALGNRRNSLEAKERRLHVEIEDIADMKMSETLLPTKEGNYPLYSPIKHGNEDNTIDIAAIFHSLYQDYDFQVARQISKTERKANGYISTTLTYGEIEFIHFQALFETLMTTHDVLTKPGGTFLDIGCGTGRPVFAAALLHDFDACIGYEILEGLAAIAQIITSNWQRVKKSLNALKKRTRIEICHEDATQIEWPAADVIFCNSTCFDDRLMRAITKQALVSLKKGGMIITATKQLQLNDETRKHIGLVQKYKMQGNWGIATMYMYKRVG